MSQRRPAHEIRLGMIRAAIWANSSGPNEAWFNVTVSRLYKDGDRWKDSGAFGRDDLPIVAMQQRDVTLQEIYASHLKASHLEKAHAG